VDKYVDTSGWTMKTMRIKMAMAKDMPKVVQKGAQDLHDKVDKNTKGGKHDPYFPGKLPVRRQTGDLARALYLKMLHPLAYAVGIDGKIAPHWIYVHYGTKKMKARRFFEDALNERRAAIVNNIRYGILKIIRKVGR